MASADVEQVAQAREDERVSLRLERLERLEELEQATMGELLGVSKATLAAVQELVKLGQAREARELEELKIEEKRREQSGEALLKRTDAEVLERRVRGAWLREQAGKLLTPLGAVLLAGATALVGGLTAWLNGWIGRSP